MNAQNRLLEIKIPFIKKYLILKQFKGAEQLSVPFKFELTVCCREVPINPQQFIGKSSTVIIKQRETQSPHYFNGIINSVISNPCPSKGYSEYQLTMVPWLWLLSLNSDCQIFQNQTTPEIINSLFKKFGQCDFVITCLEKKYPRHEFCVQYNETTLNFISRLLEDTGIFYYFSHEHDKHMLILGDSENAYQHFNATKIFINSQQYEKNSLLKWEQIVNYQNENFSRSSYHFLTPHSKLLVDTRSQARNQGIFTSKPFIKFHYPGSYHNLAECQNEINLLKEQQETERIIVESSSVLPNLMTGTVYNFTKKRNTRFQNNYLITKIEHFALDNSHNQQHTTKNNSPLYRNKFTCIPAENLFRPPKISTRPTITGIQARTSF